MEDLLICYQCNKDWVDLVDRTIRSKLPNKAQILLATPGMRPIIAVTILEETGYMNSQNLPSADQLVTYSVLIPSLVQSTTTFNHLGLIPRSLLRLCHSREGGNPGSDIFSGHPPARV